MLILPHFLVSLILLGIFYPIYKLSALVIIIGGVLIDMDHYLLYIIKFKSLDIKKAYFFFRDEYDSGPYNWCAIFHTIEFLILIFILSFFFRILFLFFIGAIVHVICDKYYNIKYEKKMRVFSFILWFRKFYKEGKFSKS